MKTKNKKSKLDKTGANLSDLKDVTPHNIDFKDVQTKGSISKIDEKVIFMNSSNHLSDDEVLANRILSEAYGSV